MAHEHRKVRETDKGAPVPEPDDYADRPIEKPGPDPDTDGVPSA